MRDAEPVAIVTTRLVPGRDLATLGERWDALAAAALEENGFYARPVVLAGLRTVDDPEAIRVLCVERRTTAGRRDLIGLLPLRISRFRYGAFLPVARAANNVYQTSGTPLIHREHAAQAADALLGAFGTLPGLPRRALVPNLRLDGPVAGLLRESAARVGAEIGRVGDLARPVLRPGPETGDSFLARHVAPKRLREWRRTERRLGEIGALTYRHLTSGPERRTAVEDFLRMEAAGWKGAAGTALASDPRTERFAREAFGAADSIGTADVLALDGRAIAMCLNLQAGRVSFAIKCAYDETLRRHSPGVLLEMRVIEHLFAARHADEIDSCTTEPDHLVADMWNGVASVGTLTISAAGNESAVPFDLAAAERTRAAARARARHALHAARDRYGEARASTLAFAQSDTWHGGAGPPGVRSATGRSLRDLPVRCMAALRHHADLAVAVAAFA